jgi:hypothetical protein
MFSWQQITKEDVIPNIPRFIMNAGCVRRALWLDNTRSLNIIRLFFTSGFPQQPNYRKVSIRMWCRSGADPYLQTPETVLLVGV